MSGQGWLIPKGADGGDFKYEVQFLQSIARPLEESTEAARKLAGDRAQERMDFASLHTLDKTGTADVTDAVDAFLDKWCHGLGCIADDADVIVAALSSTINTFLVTETKVAYDMMMVRLEKEYRDEHPVTTWLEEEHGITGTQRHFGERGDTR